MATQPQDNPPTGELYAEILRREKQFHRLLIFAWSSVELDVDRLVTSQFGVNWNYIDPKVQFLVKSPFWKKLSFLREIGVVTLEESNLIQTFQKHRNEFFHTFGTARVENQGAEEVERMMDEAVAASNLAYKIVRRQLQENEN